MCNKISKTNILVISHRYQTGNQKWIQKERKINNSSQLYKISDFLDIVSKLSDVKIETKLSPNGGKQNSFEKTYLQHCEGHGQKAS